MVKSNEETSVNIPEWLNEQVLVEILQQDYKDYKEIKQYDIGPTAGCGENYSTVLLRATAVVELKDGSQVNTSYMFKILPSSEAARAMVTEWRVFEKETNTYQNYLPEFEQMYKDANKDVTFGPKYYKITVKAGELVVALEDLGNKGAKNINRHDGLDMQHTKAVLEKLAQFHAASAVRFERKGPYPEIYNRNLNSPPSNKFDEYRKQIEEVVLSLLPLYEAENLETVLKTYAIDAPDNFQAVAPKFDDEFRVINHGDAWCNNMMFRHDEAGNILETYLIDLQMSRYGSPAQDLIYLILSSVNKNLKLSNFDYFIYYYHEKLTENLKLLQYPKALPTLRGLHKSLFDHGDWAYTSLFFLLPIVLFDSNKDANMDSLIDADNAKNMRIKMYRNPRLVQQLKRCLPWAYNRGCFDPACKAGSSK